MTLVTALDVHLKYPDLVAVTFKNYSHICPLQLIVKFHADFMSVYFSVYLLLPGLSWYSGLSASGSCMCDDWVTVLTSGTG